jgi:hypothetical protein
MKIARQILLYALLFLTLVGDLTIFIFKTPFRIISWLGRLISNFGKTVKCKFPKRKKKVKAIKIFPLAYPITTKIKYFFSDFLFYPLDRNYFPAGIAQSAAIKLSAGSPDYQNF